MAKTDADKRSRALESVNAAIANVEIAKERVHRAKSELGTAERELSSASNAYRLAREQLDKLMPPFDEDASPTPSVQVPSGGNGVLDPEDAALG